jgi:O-acetylserine/cysteine efflux transporter
MRGRGWVLAAGVGLFLVWSNSFVAASFLLGGERSAARLDALGVTLARFLPILPFTLGWLLVRRRQSLALLGRFPGRALAAGLLGVPAYNLALYAGQQLGVPPPVASLATALTPLFVMLLAAAALGEPLTLRNGIAFAIALAGLVLIAASRTAGDAAAGGGPATAAAYGALLALVAVAPLSWGIYSILSKPVAAVATALDWTMLTVSLGTLPLVALLPLRSARLAALDLPGWGAALYLAIPCTLVGYAVWSWLLRRLPAVTVGFFTFLNPPLTAVSTLALAFLFPATFLWRMRALEILGAALALAGLALALLPGGRDGGR